MSGTSSKISASQSLTKNLVKIFEVLSSSPVLKYCTDGHVAIQINSGASIFGCDDKTFNTPIHRINTVYAQHHSNLPDSELDYGKFSALVSLLSEQNNIVRLNHVGICYKVDSQVSERKRLVEEIKKTDLKIYEEPSNDQGLWLFVGDTKVWDDPMLELLPVENISDKWVEYWLPHFQIDLDTDLSGEELEQRINSVYKGTVKPFNVTVIDGIHYCVRLRLGVVSGVNINIDLATNKRNVKYVRQNMLRKLN